MTDTMKVGLVLGVVLLAGIGVFAAATSNNNSNNNANNNNGGFTPTPTTVVNNEGNTESVAVREGIRTAGSIGTAIINLVSTREERAAALAREERAAALAREQRNFCVQNPNHVDCRPASANAGGSPQRAGT